MTAEVVAAVYLRGPGAMMLECADLWCVLTGVFVIFP